MFEGSYLVVKLFFDIKKSRYIYYFIGILVGLVGYF